MTEYALWSRSKGWYAEFNKEGYAMMPDPFSPKTRFFTSDKSGEVLETIGRTHDRFQWELRTREEVEQAEQIPF